MEFFHYQIWQNSQFIKPGGQGLLFDKPSNAIRFDAVNRKPEFLTIRPVLLSPLAKAFTTTRKYEMKTLFLSIITSYFCG